MSYQSDVSATNQAGFSVCGTDRRPAVPATNQAVFSLCGTERWLAVPAIIALECSHLSRFGSIGTYPSLSTTMNPLIACSKLHRDPV